MPVGRVESAWLYPMGFGEYLIAKGNSELAKWIARPNWEQDFSEAVHEKAQRELRDYLFCGGMPQAVEAMTKHQDGESVRRVLSYHAC